MQTQTTRAQNVALWIALLSLLLIPIAPGEAAPKPDTEQPYTIALKSRQFVPVPGVERALVRDLSSTSNARRHVLIQFTEIPTAEQRSRLAAAGIRLLDYLPTNAWFASIPSSLGAKDLGAAPVRWVGQIAPDDRVAPPLRSLQAATSQEPVALEIQFFADVPPQEATRVLQAYGIEIVAEYPSRHRYAVHGPALAIDALAAQDGVQWIAPAPPPKVLDNDGSRQATNVDVVHRAPYGLTGSGVDLGIWDGGKVNAHVDFTGRLTVGENEPVHWHATHVAGTMAGDGRNSINQGGSALEWMGMAPGAQIVSYGMRGDLAAEVGEAIRTYGIELSQNSWGYDISEETGTCDYYGDYLSLSADCDAIVNGQYGKPIPVVFSGGNERNDGDCGMDSNPPYINYRNVAPPHTAKNIIAVGATNSNDDSMTTFSSWGPVDDGRLKPEVVAPGCDPDDLIYSTNGTQGYTGACGTSMSAPAVSGITALLIEQYRITQSSDPLPSTIRGLLIHTAVDMDDGNTVYYNPGPDYSSGYGRVDAQAAVDAIRARQTREDQVSNGQTDVYTLEVSSGTPTLKVTLTWDDVPGTLNAGPALVNNLDLLLIEPNGTTTHLPWVLDPSNPTSHATRGVDSINNVEQVQVDNPTLGTWRVRISGTLVPQGPQTYSLVGVAVSDSEPDHKARVSIDKSVEPTVLPPGGVLTYTVQRSIWLTGTHTFSETLVDPIPAGTTYVTNSVTLNGISFPSAYSPTLDSIYYYQESGFVDSDQLTLSFLVQAQAGTNRVVNTVTGRASIDGVALSTPYSATVSTGGCAQPAAPTLLAPANGATLGTPRPTFTWVMVEQADGYRIQVADDPAFQSPVVDHAIAGTFSTYFTSDPLSGGTYHWRVRAYDACGPGDWSQVWQLSVVTGEKLYLPIVIDGS
jgi:uncharacterized repeat protein (TIGR01451 family)